MGRSFTAPPGPMQRDMAALVTLERIGPDRFRNRGNEPNSYAALFGGQLVAQALAAADGTVDDRTVHSLHGYFVRSGTVDTPVDFAVERVRDGRSLSIRRVTAAQAGRTLFAMDCSYRIALPGFSHQRPQEIRFAPDEAIDVARFAAEGRHGAQRFIDQFARAHPVEIRLPSMTCFFDRGTEPRRHYWLRVPGLTTSDPALHRRVFAYLSDFLLSGAPLVPYTQALPGPHVFVASLDHAIWFHRPIRCDDWLQFETQSPSAANGINLTQAWVYDRSGALVASVAQEALQSLTGEDPPA